VRTNSYFIGIDIGTTATKGVAFDAAGHVIGYRSVHYDMTHPRPDWAEQEPEPLWQAVLACLDELVGKLGEGCQLIALSTAMHSLMAIDEAGTPLTNFILWADNRATAEARTLLDSELGQRLYESSGTPIHPMTPLCKLIWLRENDPDLFARTRRFIGIKEFIWHRFTGTYEIDTSLATATGLFDLETSTWNRLALETAGITADQLATPVSPLRSFAFRVSSSEFRVLSFNSKLKTLNAKLIIGASDGCLANLGTGAITPGRVAITIGTSGAVRMASPVPATDAQMRTFCYRLDDELFILGGGTNSGGAVFEWLYEQFLPGQTGDEVIALAETVPPGADGLLFLPYLLGERAPLWNADAKGVFFGLTLRHTPAHLARAVLEGICLHTASLVRILEERQPVREIYASGGFAKNTAWVQLLADACGKPVRLPESVQAGAWGAVLLGMKSLGLIGSYDEKLDGLVIRETFYPHEKTTQTYRDLADRFASLYKATKALM
jgi:gluconokinase